jgi:peptidoglycan/LPS O-acetylase OafA/YrhL
MEADLEKAYLADRQSARQRDTEYIKAGRHTWRADILAALAVAGLIICVWFVARDTDMPERATNAIMFVAGVLAAAVRDVYSFEFGSSRGSKEKDDALQRALGRP